MRITRRGLLRAGLSTGVAAVLAACGDGPKSGATDQSQGGEPSVAEIGPLPQTNSVERTKFAMVGDSITKASSKPLTTVLEGMGYTQVSIDAEVSRRIEVGDGRSEPLAGVKTMQSMISDGVSPDVWAIGLGTNDVGKYPDAAAYAALIDEMMSIPAGDVPLVWVDVYNPNQLTATKLFNEVLRDRAGARGNAVVLSWFDLASTDSKILRSDHIHPNDKGTLVFADLVSKALA